MAACSELEEKTSSSEVTLPFKLVLEGTSGHCRNELSNKLSEGSKTGDLTTLSDDEFLHLLKEASTFNKPNNQESVLLKQLRKEVAETEPRENANVDERSEHKHSKILLCNSNTSSSHKTIDGKRKSKNREDSKNALNSDKNVQQSLSLQDLLSPESKTKKSHKAHRTLSLSSEEAAAILSDSLSETPKTSKKSNKLSNSKSELGKTNFLKCNSKTSYSGSAKDSGQKRKYDALIQNSTLPYVSLINECDIPLPDGPPPQDKVKTSSESPIEIEMEEIKSKASTKEVQILTASRNTEKNKSTLQQSNSKFYVDSNEVDTTLAYPLQLVSSMENGSFSVPWSSQPLQVQALLGALPADANSFISPNDKQLLNSDINGNPFSKSSHPHINSFVSSSLMEYNHGNSTSENKNRKAKRLRNAVNKGVLSENIAGHRGEEDIDTLLQYINSSDKKGKSVKGNNTQNQLVPSKSVFHENDRKKSIGKDLKNCHKNMINVKKKLSRSNSLENLVSNTRHHDKSSALSYESNAILDKPLKNSKTATFEKPIEKTLDINSNVELQFSDTTEKMKDSSGTDESSPEVSSFAADFYSTADVSSQTVEESGFLIVKKKQRKKHQGKRSESYRWRTNQAQRKKGMMIPLAESKCGKQDSRRKSTSSVPHSEHSSADNSDLDSVHSLPVRGSVPHPTQPHPHTTPSSSSSTPQASYADIARMPIQKLNSPSPCVMTYSSQASVAKQQQTGDYEPRKLDAPANNFSCMKRRVSDVREPVPVVNKSNPRTTVVDDSVYSEVKIRSYAKSTREINTQTEPEPSNNELDSMRDRKTEESPKSTSNICCPQKKNCSCSKSQTAFRQKIKSSDIPPVIMDNMPAETNACNVSFGFGVEEVLLMTPTKQTSKTEALCSESKDSNPTKSSKTTSNLNKTPSASDSCNSSLGVPIKTDLSSETSSHLRTVCYGTGRNICYNETTVNTKKFNLSEITNFLGKEFQCIKNELGVSKSNGVSSKIVYYVDSAEEA